MLTILEHGCERCLPVCSLQVLYGYLLLFRARFFSTVPPCSIILPLFFRLSRSAQCYFTLIQNALRHSLISCWAGVYQLRQQARGLPFEAILLLCLYYSLQ